MATVLGRSARIGRNLQVWSVVVTRNNSNNSRSLRKFESRLHLRNQGKPKVTETNRKLSFSEFEGGISIRFGSESRQLPHVWLRDHSRDPASYNHDTHQRNHMPHHIDPAIRPEEVSVQDNKLTVRWAGGQPVSTFDPEWLLENAYPGPEERVHRFIWDDAAISRESPQPVQMEEFMQKDETLKEFLRALLKYGFAMVDGVVDEDGKPTVEATEKAARRVCAVQETQLFGKTWCFTDDAAASDTAWTNVALGAHTDTTYFSTPAGVQVFHVLRPAPRGGDTLLVDGFHAAETLRHDDPTAFSLLTEHRVEHEYIESHHGRSETPQGHVRSLAPVLTTHPVSGELECVRYNPFDRAPLRTVNPRDLPGFYRALAALSRKVESPRREHWVKLTPGTTLFIDNWRVLHGRSAFSGERRVAGCYLPRDDWVGRARCLGLVQ